MILSWSSSYFVCYFQNRDLCSAAYALRLVFPIYLLLLFLALLSLSVTSCKQETLLLSVIDLLLSDTALLFVF
jgi:hypothetical protein